MEEQVEVWQPISFNQKWEDADTSIFDDLAPSWYKKRRELQDGDEEFEEYIERLKRQHAIETGIVERLYDLNEGITETLIKEGFVDAYISHHDTNIPPGKLMQHLHDHFEAMDFIFDLVKSNRELTISFIKELHQLVTQHQDYTEAINSLGERVSVELIKGEFKERENNPRRSDGKIFTYCPPIHVDNEMDKLIRIYQEQYDKDLHPIILSAWFHHAFTQIHPFQDGNGRIARLLSSLILIKDGLLPFTVKRNDKSKYIDALEGADQGNPQLIISFFAQQQKRAIENALNFRTPKSPSSLKELASLLNESIDNITSEQKKKREEELKVQRKTVFDYMTDILGEIKEELFELIPIDRAEIYFTSVRPDQERNYYFTKQIIEYASKHDYYFNRNLPRGWFGINFTLPNDRRYYLVLTIHHYGYEDDVLAVGAFLEYFEQSDGEEEKSAIPIDVEPFTISLEGIKERTAGNLNAYVHDILKVALTIIINDVN